jgi:imidazolonepropionase-like amidohydrolase
MARLGIASVPTLVPYRYIMRKSGGYFGSTSRRFTLNEDSVFDMLRKLKAAGVKLGVGTDMVVDWNKYQPFAYIDELKSFTMVGYSNSEALVAATRTSAEILKMADRLGTLEPGKLADITILNGDPTENLDNLAKVDRVLVNGRVVVEDGRIYVPKREPVPPPERKPLTGPPEKF